MDTLYIFCALDRLWLDLMNDAIGGEVIEFDAMAGENPRAAIYDDEIGFDAKPRNKGCEPHIIIVGGYEIFQLLISDIAMDILI